MQPIATPTPAATPSQNVATTPVARMELVQLAPHIYQLQWIAGERPVAAPAPAAPTVLLPDARQSRSGALRVAIVNGNGVPGMAQKIGQLLTRRGIAVSRLSNERPYRQRRTEIGYPRGHENDARALNEALGGMAVIVRLNPDADRHGGAELRLVLGKDGAPAIALRATFGNALAAN
jgi:hypothetical protein